MFNTHIFYSTMDGLSTLSPLKSLEERVGVYLSETEGKSIQGKAFAFGIKNLVVN